MTKQHQPKKRRTSKPAKLKELHILNLGAGVQSTALYLMSVRGEHGIPRFDAAVFGDTQEEPEAVYRHLEWLESLNGPPILKDTVGKLGDDLINGIDSMGQRFASVPFFTSDTEGELQGITNRQCTREYKIDPCNRIVRRQILGLKKGKAIPACYHVHRYFGLSYEEAGRAARVAKRFAKNRRETPHFPLYDMVWTRADCRRYLESIGIPHRVPRSACVFCPFKSNEEWRLLRDEDPAGWARAVEVDYGARNADAVCGKGLQQRLYVHRSCVPLDKAPIDEPEYAAETNYFSFARECEGMCGI